METKELLVNSSYIALFFATCIGIFGIYKAWKQTKHPEFKTNLKENHKMFFICLQTLIIVVSVWLLWGAIAAWVTSGSYILCIAAIIFIIMLESWFLHVKKLDNRPQNAS